MLFSPDSLLTFGFLVYIDSLIASVLMTTFGSLFLCGFLTASDSLRSSGFLLQLDPTHYADAQVSPHGKRLTPAILPVPAISCEDRRGIA